MEDVPKNEVLIILDNIILEIKEEIDYILEMEKQENLF
jgi:hypothetical protein